jgi:hypothetical protein
MPTLDWLNRSSALTLAARAPYRLLEQVSFHTAAAPAHPGTTQASADSVQVEPVEATADNALAVRSATPLTDKLLIQGDNLDALKALQWQGCGFRLSRLGEAVFDEAGRIHPAVRFATLAAFIWQQETGSAFNPLKAKPGTPYFGINYQFDSCSRPPDMGRKAISLLKTPRFASYLLFNRILKDERFAAKHQQERWAAEIPGWPSPERPISKARHRLLASRWGGPTTATGLTKRLAPACAIPPTATKC